MMITLNLGAFMHYIMSIKKGLQTILNLIFGIPFLLGRRDSAVRWVRFLYSASYGYIPDTPVFSSPHKPI